MSSPLDGRIRALAREEAAEAIRGMNVTAAPDAQSLQKQITDLHEHLHHVATLISRLEARVDALEAAATTGAAESISRRTRRKATDE